MEGWSDIGRVTGLVSSTEEARNEDPWHKLCTRIMRHIAPNLHQTYKVFFFPFTFKKNTQYLVVLGLKQYVMFSALLVTQSGSVGHFTVYIYDRIW